MASSLYQRTVVYGRLSVTFYCNNGCPETTFRYNGNMHVVLISTYELGHQPFGLASPAAWLAEAGAQVSTVDLAVRPFAEAQTALQQAGLIAFYLPMHTATRLAPAVIKRATRLNPQAHLAAYGLYAPMNETYLRQLGVETILGGEFEQGLVDLYTNLTGQTTRQLPLISLARQQFQPPQRQGLPALTEYAHLDIEAEQRTVGYTETTRGCKHTCRHCPIVPVYNGRFRIIQADVVLTDIRQQVAAGARHITFGDPDFLNGPGHVLPLVTALQAEFPDVTYDVTIKVEHLLQQADKLSVLRETGCVLITSAVESLDETTLTYFDKGHTVADVAQVVTLLQEAGIALNPTFVSFTPWTTIQNYAEFLAAIDNMGLVDQVAPIQYAIRLLIPAGSKLLELSQIQALVRPFDEAALRYPWSHPDRAVDDLYEAVFKLIKACRKKDESRRVIFERLWQLVSELCDPADLPTRDGPHTFLSVPTISEDWY